MKIISYSLWGKSPMYVINAIKNADIAETLFPNWVCYYYISPTVPQVIVDELNKRKNAKVILMTKDESWNGMFWRFLAASLAPTREDAMISRDADSLLNIRDKAAVDEWLKSDKDFHIMRDNCAHNAPIMGGMWGCRNSILSDIVQLVDSYTKKETNNRKNIDQEFLWDVVYPKVKNRAFIHDPYHFFPDNSRNFPIPRRGPFTPTARFGKFKWPTPNDPWPSEETNGLMYCGNCKKVHDNDYIGKFALEYTEEDYQKYPFKEIE